MLIGFFISNIHLYICIDQHF